jgi:predicted amidohydrolase
MGTVKVAAGCSPPWSKISWKLDDTIDVLNLVRENIDEILRVTDLAADAGAVAVAFPEDTLGLHGWLSGHLGDEKRVLDPAVEMMLQAASRTCRERRIYMVLCSDMSNGAGISNTAVLVGRDGKEVGRYRKVNLPITEQTKIPGDGFPVFETEELGGVGMCICYDLVHPETARALALGGADLVFHLTLGGAAATGREASDAAFITRAAENEIYLVVAFGKQSRVIAPNGRVLATIEKNEPFVIAEFDPRSPREFGGAVGGICQEHRASLFRDRRPSAYSILVDPNPPALSKFRDPALPTPEAAARLAAEVLTTGSDRFHETEALANAGEYDQALRGFEELSSRFGTTWIGRGSRRWVEDLRQGGQWADLDSRSSAQSSGHTQRTECRRPSACLKLRSRTAFHSSQVYTSRSQGTGRAVVSNRIARRSKSSRDPSTRTRMSRSLPTPHLPFA